MYAGKPIIGIAGGIGSGKSHVARILGRMGCLVIDSDNQVREAYRDPSIVAQLHRRWGEQVLLPGGEVNRGALARIIFSNSREKERLENLIHPWVTAARDRQMAAAGGDPEIIAFVWDTPLLFEKGLSDTCDAVLFVESDALQRQQRVMAERGWDSAELARRENFQWPLDRKRQISDYVVNNAADVTNLCDQLQAVLSKIIRATEEKA